MVDPKSPADSAESRDSEGAIEKPQGSSDRRLTKSPEWFGRFLDVQEQELRLRGEEIQARKEEGERGHEYALKALSAQVGDLKDDRQTKHKQTIARQILGGFVFLVLVGLICFLVHTQNAKLAEEIIKAGIYIGASGLGGYAWGSRKGRDKTPDSDGEE